MDAIMSTWYISLMYLVVVTTVMLVIALVLSKYIHTRMSAFDEKMRAKATRYMLPAVLTNFVFFTAETFFLPAFRETAVGPLLTFPIFAGAFITLIYTIFASTESIQKQADAQLKEMEKEYYYTQCKLMQESVEQVKSIRHDLKIHLATIKGYAADINADEITNYLNNLLGEIHDSETYSNTGNITFDSIINFKLSHAGQDNIKADLCLLIPPALEIEMADIVTIIGNLLDNALEAIAKAEEKWLKLDIEYSKGGLFIKLENTFNGEITYAEDEKRILSNKNSDSHGYGLKNINKSVEKYDGYMKITHEGNIFSTVVFLYETSIPLLLSNSP
jgi:sensor histidine kinase regulating citrate/malate metabolism